MFTRRGKTLLASSVVIYGIARWASIGEMFALAVAALVFPLVSAVAVRVGRRALTFTRTVEPRRAFAGNVVRVAITVRNDAPRRSPPLLIQDDLPPSLGGPLRSSVPTLAPGDHTTIVAERTTAARGRYEIGPLRARIVDPFGLASIDRIVAETAALMVYPAIEQLTEQSPPEARGGGGRSAAHRVAISGDELYGVREYALGDDLRKIHWRSTARRGDLMIRQDEVRPLPRATLLVDTRGVDPSHDPALEYAVSMAASVVWELARRGFALRLATADTGPGAPRWGRDAVDPLLGSLAVVGRSSARSLLPAMRRASGLGAGGALIAIVPPPAPDAFVALSRLRRAYSWAGVVVLDVASFRRATARERAAADHRLAEIERMMTRAGWNVVIAGATDPIRSVWQHLLAAAARRPSSPSLHQ